MIEISQLITRFKDYVRDWDLQIEQMESGTLRTHLGAVDTTAETLAKLRKQRDDLQAIIDARSTGS